jgi:hypothetical protein
MVPSLEKPHLRVKYNRRMHDSPIPIPQIRLAHNETLSVARDARLQRKIDAALGIIDHLRCSFARFKLDARLP